MLHHLWRILGRLRHTHTAIRIVDTDRIEVPSEINGMVAKLRIAEIRAQIGKEAEIAQKEAITEIQEEEELARKDEIAERKTRPINRKTQPLERTR